LVFDIFYINKSIKFESDSVGESAGIGLTDSVGESAGIGLTDSVGESAGIGLTDSVGESADVSKLFLNFFLQLIKKNLHPNPFMRLKYDEITKIYDYIIYTIKKSEVNFAYDTFIKGLTAFLTSNSINLKIVFDKKFSYLDFRIIINNTMVDFIKNKL
jgi:hypothetical protein